MNTITVEFPLTLHYINKLINISALFNVWSATCLSCIFNNWMLFIYVIVYFRLNCSQKIVWNQSKNDICAYSFAKHKYRALAFGLLWFLIIFWRYLSLSNQFKVRKKHNLDLNLYFT